MLNIQNLKVCLIVWPTWICVKLNECFNVCLHRCELILILYIFYHRMIECVRMWTEHVILINGTTHSTHSTWPSYHIPFIVCARYVFMFISPMMNLYTTKYNSIAMIKPWSVDTKSFETSLIDTKTCTCKKKC